ncbi:MAG: hypothetical protein IPH09_12090 [bacterium]|nr:hypothetical protein [bacterium]
MKTTHKLMLLALLLAISSVALATTVPNGAVITTRIWNDCPLGTVTSTNNYGTLVSIHEQKVMCGAGWGSRHNWRFADGGVAQNFANGDGFSYSCDLTISGTGEAEATLAIAPWWSQAVGGAFNFRTNDGEIACFGGRLPFYSFTGSQGLHYVKGETVHAEVVYLPNGLNAGSPATIEYKVTIGGTLYTSGALAFDMGNPAEPYGTWGMLDNAQVGGDFLQFLQQGDLNGYVQVDWANITFEDLGTVANEDMTWGNVKTLYR